MNDTDTDTTVTLERREWRQVLSVMQLGIEVADDRGFTKVASARESLYDDIRDQIRNQYDGELQTFSDILRSLEDEFGMEQSLYCEEVGRKNAHLQD